MKDANSSTRLKPKQTTTAVPEEDDEHRVRPGSDEHRQNQESLGVGPDHRTEDMKREDRGTFP